MPIAYQIDKQTNKKKPYNAVLAKVWRKEYFQVTNRNVKWYMVRLSENPQFLRSI